VQAIGDAFTLMSPEEKTEVAAIERFLGRSIPRVMIPDFDYKKHADASSRSAPHGGRGRDGGGGGRREGGRGGRGEPRATVPRPAGPAEPDHGRRPKRNSPDRRRRRM